MCNCWSTDHLLYMLAGASFWEAIIHVLLHFSGALPLTVWGFTMTQQNNLIIVGGALLLGFVFLYLAKRARYHSNCSSC